MECFLEIAVNFRKFPANGEKQRRPPDGAVKSGVQILPQDIALEGFIEQGGDHQSNDGVGQHIGAVVDQGIGI